MEKSESQIVIDEIISNIKSYAYSPMANKRDDKDDKLFEIGLEENNE